MRAAVTTEPYHIQMEEREKPEYGPREVLVRMKASGICGSDIHFYDGSHPYANYPQIFGHELSGIVDKVGSEVTKIQPGDRVVIEPGIPCGECYPCRIGKYNCCKNINIIGAFRPGGFADYVMVPEDYAHLMPDEMSHEMGALCEPFTIGAQVISRADPQPGSTVTILGMGPIGLTVLIQLKQLYDVKVFVVDVVEARLKKARFFGADETINPKGQDVIKTVDELTAGEGSNIVIESAGLKLTMEQSIHLVSPGGRIVIVGLTNDSVSFPGILFTNKEVEIFGSRNNIGKFPQVIRFLNEHQTIAESYITKQMPFTEIGDAFHIAKTQPNEINKMILNYD